MAYLRAPSLLLSFFLAITTASHLELDVADISPNLNLNTFSLLPRGLPTGTCNGNTPCVNAACCGTNGLCGYSPTECGSGNCTSNCDAKAQCGPYAATGQQSCPLNVCCSQFGFCGSTDDFCAKGCQSGYGGCGPPNRPSCGGGGSVSKRTIGYYESWSNNRQCQSVSPEELNLNGFTHINFAFAFFDPSSFAIAPMDGSSGALYNRFTALKNNNRGLQTWISVGGWSFTDPGPTRTAFSVMSSSSGNRATFINGLMHFMDTYGFDGVDLDWEYPQADDRGGVNADKENYVSLVKEMRTSFGSKYGISMTLPTSYWYLQHFDLEGIAGSVDWFNFMAYDLHGVWDAESQFVGPYIAPHTNITEIDLGLDLLWRAGVTPDKVVMGQGWYGRSFTWKDPSCNTPNGICQFSGPANAGPCSNAAGILDDQEIQNIISTNGLTPVLDKAAAVKWITWDSNQWVSYDDAETFALKRDFANSRCLGGLMVWAMDQVDQSADNNLAPAPGVTSSDQQDAQQMSNDLAAGITCYTTGCNEQCKKGTNSVAQMNGQPGQLSTNDKCPKGQYRTLCCDDGTLMGICQWRGYRGAGMSCIKGCADGETDVVDDTNHHDKNGDYTCSGGLQSYCCKGFRPAPSKQDLKDQAEDAAKSAAEAAAEQAALDIAAKAFCRIAVPALLAPLEALEDLIPIIGEIADIAEIAATPELIQLCVKGVEKEGKAEFKIFGKEHTISGFNKPTDKPPETRPPESTHTTPKTSSTDCAAGPGRLAKRARECRQKTVEEPTSTVYSDGHIVPLTCMAAEYSQACLHYNSVINSHAGGQRLYNNLPCFLTSKERPPGPWTRSYNDQHIDAWQELINPLPETGCQPDEWPPAYILQGSNDQQWIRLIDGGQNQRAGQIWKKKCPKAAESSFDADPKEDWVTNKRGNIEYVTKHGTMEYTRSTLSMAFVGVGGYVDDGIPENACYPSKVVNDPGFALLTQDPWYDAHPALAANKGQYTENPPAQKKRNIWFDPAAVVFDDGNSSRKATDEELKDKFGLLRCTNESCSEERRKLGIASAMVLAPLASAPAAATVLSTTAPSVPEVTRLLDGSERRVTPGMASETQNRV